MSLALGTQWFVSAQLRKGSCTHAPQGQDEAELRRTVGLTFQMVSWLQNPSLPLQNHAGHVISLSASRRLPPRPLTSSVETSNHSRSCLACTSSPHPTSIRKGASGHFRSTVSFNARGSSAGYVQLSDPTLLQFMKGDSHYSLFCPCRGRKSKEGYKIGSWSSLEKFCGDSRWQIRVCGRAGGAAACGAHRAGGKRKGVVSSRICVRVENTF